MNFSSLRPAGHALLRSVQRQANPLAPRILPAMAARWYAATTGLSSEEITDRVFNIIKAFEGINPDAVNKSASFTEDLKLDSLDTVEVVMHIENEFSIEIPDEDADNIKTVGQAIEYVAKRDDAS
ncbi:acyl carrier protein-like protein [Syncephalis fuscata]|nr:acyl carrier protein-like protein [Syncephalis fuscata]